MPVSDNIRLLSIFWELIEIKKAFPELRYGQGYIHCNPDLGGTTLEFDIWEDKILQSVAEKIYNYQSNPKP